LDSDILKLRRCKPNISFNRACFVGEINEIPLAFKVITIVDISVEIVIVLGVSCEMIIFSAEPDCEYSVAFLKIGVVFVTG
jgi:hypothetical protein